jgi:hypothetical protein
LHHRCCCLFLFCLVSCCGLLVACCGLKRFECISVLYDLT